MVLKKWSTVTMLSEDRCKATSNEAIGCYSCEAGTTAEVNCYTRNEDTMANVECEKEVFAIRCTPKGHNTNITFFANNAKFRRTCSISCVENSEGFEIKGNMNYSGSIWTSIHRAIRGDTTRYNKINFPDIGHVIDSYIGYMKTVIIVLAIVGIGFLLTYTMIPQAGFKVVKNILKGKLCIFMILIEILFFACQFQHFLIQCVFNVLVQLLVSRHAPTFRH
uniref:Phlebovirus glycoprotein G2 fusion domain-containing protein n=1 Tax=Caenorhabditis japonica TaxID=281687 RepID=A0A8R1DGK6_CAEJA